MPTTYGKPSRTTGNLLWVLQALLAALFLFAGGMKLVMPVAELTRQGQLPGLFLRFIGLTEVLGALGLILPGLLRIRTGLTPIAAVGLTIIMIGAVGTTMVTAGAVPALMPGVVCVVAGTVAIGRWREAGTAARRSVREAPTAQLAEVG